MIKQKEEAVFWKRLVAHEVNANTEEELHFQFNYRLMA